MVPRGDSSDQRGGIRVKRETVIILSDREDVASQTTSPTITVHADNGRGGGQVQQQYGQPKAFRKLSNSSSLLSDIFRHPETSEEALRRKIKQANERDTHELVDFLRNTTPPPHNRMSLLGGTHATHFSHRKKRRSFWPFWGCRRKKSERKMTPPSTPLIRLPDTAIAGRTTGGHRHIAISIPIEHAHLDLLEPTELYDQEEPKVEGKSGVEQPESLDVNGPPPTPPLIPEINCDVFGSILSPCHSLRGSTSGLSGSSSSSSSSYSTEVGHAPVNLALTSRTLTANPKQDAVVGIVSVTNPRTPRLRHLPCRIPKRPPLAESEAIGSTSSAVSCGNKTLKCCPPRLDLGSSYKPSPSPVSAHLDAGHSSQEMSCSVCLDPAIASVDTPSPSRPMSPVQQFVTARPSITSMYQANLQISEDSLTSNPGLGSASMRGSMESMLLNRRRSWQVLVAHDSPGPMMRPRNQGHEMRQSVGQLDSYQKLRRRYQELGRKRDRELNVLLERLNGLERDHRRWMRAIVPVLEGLTRGMLARYEHCEEGGFGNYPGQPAHGRRESGNVGELVDTPERVYCHGQDSISDHDAASFVSPGNDVTEIQGGDEGIDLSGIENIELIMREILGQDDWAVAGDIGIARGGESIDNEFEVVFGDSDGIMDSKSGSGAS